MPEYRFKETKLNCPKCKKGKARLVISRKEGKEYKFFRCSEYDCDWNGGFYNQDNNKIDIIDNCPSCDGILYVRNGKNGPFLGCSHFPDCKQTRELTEEEGRLLDEKSEKSLDSFIGDKLDSKGANPLGNDKEAEKNHLNNTSNKEESEKNHLVNDSNKEEAAKNTPSNDSNKEEDEKSSQDNPLNKEEAVYERIETELKCPDCGKGHVVLVIKIKGDNETKFFRCSEDDCHWNGGFYNRDEIKTDVLEHCPRCNGIVYEKIGRKGPFMACSNFPKCRYSRNVEKFEDDWQDQKSENKFSQESEEPIEQADNTKETAIAALGSETQRIPTRTKEEPPAIAEERDSPEESIIREDIQKSPKKQEKSEIPQDEKPKASYERFETKLLCPECMEGQVILIRNMDTGKGFFRCTSNDCDWDGGPYSQPLKQLKHITYCQEPGCKGINYFTEGKYGPYKACTWFSKTGCRPKIKR